MAMIVMAAGLCFGAVETFISTVQEKKAVSFVGVIYSLITGDGYISVVQLVHNNDNANPYFEYVIQPQAFISQKLLLSVLCVLPLRCENRCVVVFERNIICQECLYAVVWFYPHSCKAFFWVMLILYIV